MRKLFLAIACIWCCLFGFTACDPGRNHINAEETIAHTVKIELVYYENTAPKLLKLKGAQKPKFDFNKATLLETLDENQFENIITESSALLLLLYNRTTNEPIGKTIIFHQDNGDMLVLYYSIFTNAKQDTFYYGDCVRFNKDGEFIEYLGDIDSLNSYNTIISNYFPNHAE